MYYSIIKSPVGKLGLAATPKGLCRLETNLASEKEFVDRLKRDYGLTPEKRPSHFKNIENQLSKYFSGKLQKFNIKLDLDQGTEFQQSVWKKLTAIPSGKTRSYQWLAKAISNPRACRAVGNANGKNPLSIIVPCHRVIQENGTMGGYSGGVHIKSFLLDLENRVHAHL